MITGLEWATRDMFYSHPGLARNVEDIFEDIFPHYIFLPDLVVFLPVLNFTGMNVLF